ncbi:MAG: adenylyl-sulfate reductase subunit alpha [Clostridiales Family XIII bacterium]|nr:adenylyl-sulfate reductase subunit alpha [Clostridiales Family XIII bacterium]
MTPVSALRTCRVETDLLIIGGGTAGCFAALTFCKHSKGSVLIAEKADIRRSGCLAAGVNALNAYIAPGKAPQSYVDYARADAEGIVRGDLLLTMSEGLNEAAAELERLGLVILKDAGGGYAMRGERNVKINGENIKPLLAEAVRRHPQIRVLNHVNVTDLTLRDGAVRGAAAIDVRQPVFYEIAARAVLCATGGASGLYRPNNPGFSRHKMWYPPFNTGAGYAMGIRAGAEMTSLEMRFVALRCKGTIAPTGTLAQGVGARQVNARGEVYEGRYGLSTSQRLLGTVTENAEGRGPCCLRTAGITKGQSDDLLRAYLNMAPSQTLRWVESGRTPDVADVPIEGTEPYIVGGHTAAGYWVSTARETTLPGLYAAGDAAGGCPQKYVTGACVEGAIAARAAARALAETAGQQGGAETAPPAQSALAEAEGFLRRGQSGEQTDALEEEMQSVMDEYAGGIGQGYQCHAEGLAEADGKIRALEARAGGLGAADMQGLTWIYELRDRLTLCRSLIAHLAARRETRWPGFVRRADYPAKDDAFLLYVNSRMQGGEVSILHRPLVGEAETYEH